MQCGLFRPDGRITPTFRLSEVLQHSYLLQTVVGKIVKTLAQIQ